MIGLALVVGIVGLFMTGERGVKVNAFFAIVGECSPICRASLTHARRLFSF